MSQPKITIIIPNLNSPRVDETIDGIRKQDFDLSQVEVLVVGHDKFGIVKEDGWIRCIAGEKEMTAAQNRNVGMRWAKGELFCFIDGDCLPNPDWLANLVACYADPETNIVGGGIRFAPENYWSLCDHLSWFSPFLASTPSGTRNHLQTLNLSLRRSVVERAGKINERNGQPTGEDIEWTLRMRSHGYQLHFAPDAVVHHCPDRDTLRSLWKHAYEFGCFSPKVDPRATESTKELSRQRFLPRRWWFLLLLSPFLALGSTLHVLSWHCKEKNYWKALPGIWLSKMAWCCGAANTLRSKG